VNRLVKRVGREGRKQGGERIVRAKNMEERGQRGENRVERGQRERSGRRLVMEWRGQGREGRK